MNITREKFLEYTKLEVELKKSKDETKNERLTALMLEDGANIIQAKLRKVEAELKQTESIIERMKRFIMANHYDEPNN